MLIETWVNKFHTATNIDSYLDLQEKFCESFILDKGTQKYYIYAQKVKEVKMITTEYVLDKDIKVLFVIANSFPSGVLSAHQKLHSMLPSTKGRKFFGISAPNEKGSIVYKAAVEALEGEVGELSCESFVIKKGLYTSILIENYKDDIQSIERAFEKLLSNPNIDPNGFCLEMYLNDKEVRCLVGISQ